MGPLLHTRRSTVRPAGRKRSVPDETHEREHRNGGATLRAMCVSATCLALASAVVVSLWTLAFRAMEAAIEGAAIDARSKHLETSSQAISVLLGFAAIHTRTLASDIRRRSLSAEMFTREDDLNSLAPMFYRSAMREAHRSSVAEDGSNPEYYDVIGSGIMYAGFAPKDAKLCVNASFATVVRAATDDSSYLSDVQYFRVPDTNASAGANAVGSMVRELRVYDPATQRLGPVIASPPVLSCAAALAPYWEGERLSRFDQFTWFGPYDPQAGWGLHFEGGLPLIGEDGNDVGRLTTAVSLRGLTDSLVLALSRGGRISKGGHALIITRDQGLVLGNTENPLSDKLNETSLLADAVRVVKEQHGGQACPNERWHALNNQTSMDRLVSLEPFDPGRFGLPPLPDAWCVITSIPASNVQSAQDRARFLSLMVAVAGGMGILIAVLALVGALVNARSRTRQLEQEQANRAEKFVTDAMSSVLRVSFPFALVSAADMVDAGRMRTHEEMRSRGKLLILDTLDELAAFKREGNKLCFVSHQWLSASHPDPKGTQYAALMVALERITRSEIEPKPAQPTGCGQWYLWLDLHSVPQVHPGLMEMAVSTLPVYASSADLFVILAPQCAHEAGSRYGLGSYFSRGWCRAEILAKVCESGLSRTFIVASPDDALNRATSEVGSPHGALAQSTGAQAQLEAQSLLALQPTASTQLGGSASEIVIQAFTEEWLNNLSLNVFEGSFKDDLDKLRLVGPVLALYGNILKSTDPHTVQMRDHIQKEKDRFFPELLFKDYVQRIEERIQAEKALLAEAANRASGTRLSSSIFRSPQAFIQRFSSSRTSGAVLPARSAACWPEDEGTPTRNDEKGFQFHGASLRFQQPHSKSTISSGEESS